MYNKSLVRGGGGELEEGKVRRGERGARSWGGGTEETHARYVGVVNSYLEPEFNWRHITLGGKK